MLKLRVSDGGHQLPSFAQIDEHTTKLFGLRNHDIETADEIAKFVMTASIAKQRDCSAIPVLPARGLLRGRPLERRAQEIGCKPT